MNRPPQPDRPDPDRVDDLIRAWKTHGDKAARDQVVRSYAPMVKYLAARKLRGLPPNCELDDLVSCGLLALVQSIDRYDPARGNFQSYSWNRVSGAILDELRRMDWAPRSVRRNGRLIMEAREKVQRRIGAAPSNKQVAAEMNLPVEEVNRRLEALEGGDVVSLNATINRQDGSESGLDELGTLLEAAPTSAADPELAVLSGERNRLIRDAVSSLSPRERTLLFLIYVEELSGAEAGSVVGVTESRVSQILSGVRDKLKRHIHRSDSADLFDLAA